eukprot:scaffold3978_cov291-Pinguiococcus_pyrenoidosus.AAC.2
MLNTLGWSEDEFNDGAQARTLRYGASLQLAQVHAKSVLTWTDNGLFRGVEKKTYERIQRRKSTLLRHDTELQELAEVRTERERYQLHEVAAVSHPMDLCSGLQDHDAVDDGSQ